MPQVTLLGMMNSGHGCFPPVPSIMGSPNVMCGGIPVVRVGDMYAPHLCTGPDVHAAPLAAGSGTVTANGIPVGRIGDSVGCGPTVIQGFPTVVAGG